MKKTIKNRPLKLQAETVAKLSLAVVNGGSDADPDTVKFITQQQICHDPK